MTACPVPESSWPVGSSASSSCGRLASARAIATRCCSPPDSSCGRWRARSPSPTSSSRTATRSSRSRGSAATRRIGTSTFSAADRIDSSPNAWKMKPTLRRRSSTSSAGVISLTDCPSTSTCPAVGRSSPPISDRSVVLPEPDRPRTATSSPRAIRRSTPSRAWTTVEPIGKSRRTPMRLDHRARGLGSCRAGRRTLDVLAHRLVGPSWSRLGLAAGSLAGLVGASPGWSSGQTLMWSSSSSSRTRRARPSAST